MAWEDHVNQVSVDSRPRDAYALAQQWRRLAEDLSLLASSLGAVRDRTLDDGDPVPSGLGGQAAFAYRRAHQGRAWTGAAADAYRAKVQSLVDALDDLHARVTTFSGGLTRCADHLATGIAGIPVPIYYDRDLPGGTDVEDVIRNRDLDAAATNTFAARLASDRAKGGEYYRPGGFKDRADETWYQPYTGDGVALGGREQGDKSGGQLRFGETDPTDPPYLRHRDDWYAHNQATAADAHTTLANAYDSEPMTLGAPAWHGFDDKIHATDPGDSAGQQGEPRGAGSGRPSGSSFSPSTGGSSSRSFGAASSSPYRSDPSAGHFVSFPQSGASFAPQPGGTGLAGVGGGIDVPNGGGGIGPVGGSAGLLPGEVSGGGVGGIYRPGVGGFGAARGGAAPQRIPGMVVPGAASAGPGRAPMSPLSSPLRAFAEAEESRINRGAAAGGGMMPMGAGASAARDSRENTTRSWLIEDEDLWGLDDEPPSGVIR